MVEGRDYLVNPWCLELISISNGGRQGLPCQSLVCGVDLNQQWWKAGITLSILGVWNWPQSAMGEGGGRRRLPCQSLVCGADLNQQYRRQRLPCQSLVCGADLNQQYRRQRLPCQSLVCGADLNQQYRRQRLPCQSLVCGADLNQQYRRQRLPCQSLVCGADLNQQYRRQRLPCQSLVCGADLSQQYRRQRLPCQSLVCGAELNQQYGRWRLPCQSLVQRSQDTQQKAELTLPIFSKGGAHLVNQQCQILRGRRSLELLHAQQGGHCSGQQAVNGGDWCCNAHHQHQGQPVQVVAADRIKGCQTRYSILPCTYLETGVTGQPFRPVPDDTEWGGGAKKEKNRKKLFLGFLKN